MTRSCRNLIKIILHGLQMQHALDATILRTNLETQTIVLPGQLGLCKGHSLLVTYVGTFESAGFVPHLCHFLTVFSETTYLTSLSLCEWRS